MAADADADEPTEEQWGHYSYIIASRYRTIAADRLAVGPATPSQIAADSDVRITHVSRSLKELRERGLVELLVPDERKKGRVYGLTDTGRRVYETVEEYHGGGA